jgi:hypothetical protein
VTVGTMVHFPGVVVMARRRGTDGGDGRGGVGKAAAWSRRWRRSRTAWFPGVAVKAGRMAWLVGEARAWRRSGWPRFGLAGVEKGTENFGSPIASRSKAFG